jgi:acyl carrier protein
MSTNQSLSSIDGGNPAAHSAATTQRIRKVLQEHGRIGVDALEIAEDADLYEAGMTSLASVNVMLALENEFNIEFPDQFLNRSVFGSVAAIAAAIRRITGA